MKTSIKEHWTSLATPLLVEAVNLEKPELNAVLLLEAESFNPAGSVKDRIAKAMIEDAEQRAR